MRINIENIIDKTFIKFLIKAKKSTYANNKIEKCKSKYKTESRY